MFNRVKSMSLKNYFEIQKPTYKLLKLIPDTSIRNYNSSNIAKAIQYMYRSIIQRIHKEEKKFIIETPVKCSYMIDIQKDSVEFYFLVPERYCNLVKEKIIETWPKITIEEKENIKPFSTAATKYQLKYSKEDALSLKVDKKSNEPLNSILNVLNILQEGDRVGIFYNFMPCIQKGWKKQYQDTIDKIKNNEPVDREKISFKYIFKEGIILLANLIQDLLDVVGDFLGTEIKSEKLTLAEIAVSSLMLEDKKKLSKSTVQKKNSVVLNTQMLVLSDSANIKRQENNAISVLEGYNNIAEDNELVYKKISNKNIFYSKDFSMAGVEENKLSTEECQNLIQLPGRELLQQHSCINKIDVLETEIPEELRHGTIRIGTNVYKGKEQLSFMSSDKNLANLGLVVMGPQGSGKSEYFKNYAADVIKAKENLIVLDFIKNCELSSDIETVVPSKSLLIIDMGKEEDLQGFGYNEIKFRKDMTVFEILETANLIAQQDMALIDAINVEGAPLTSRMRRYLSAAANIVHLKANTSLRDVINVLEDFEIRKEIIKNIPQNLQEYLQDEIRALKELDEIKEFKNKETKEVTKEIVGTKDSKIEHILDRINLLKEDFKLKFMFNKSLENNIDFVEELEKGKIILIKIPEHKYPLKYVKNVIVTYFTTKIWLAAQLRGRINEKPLRTHVLLDEIFQAPTSENMLKDILPQCRKFQTKFIISAHYLSQIEIIKEALKASGASYMLLQGTDKKNYKELEQELDPYQLEDLLNLKRFTSLNLIKTSKGYARFISRLPKPIK